MLHGRCRNVSLIRLVEDFSQAQPAPGKDAIQKSAQALRILVSWLGADAPFYEVDVRALVSIPPRAARTHQGRTRRPAPPGRGPRPERQLTVRPPAWTMPPIETLSRPPASRVRTLALVTLCAYLFLAVAVVIIKVTQLI